MHCLQILAQLATFPRLCSPLSVSEQQKTLTELLHTACTAPVAQTSSPESPDLVSSPHPRQPASLSSSDQGAVSNLVCSALESMAKLGYEDLLRSIALPQLFSAAALPVPNLEHPEVQSAAQLEATAGDRMSSSAAPAAEKVPKGLDLHGGRDETSGTVTQPELSGRPGVSIPTALTALAGIAKASRQLHAPILGACIAGVPAALHAAAAGDGEGSLAPWHFPDPSLGHGLNLLLLNLPCTWLDALPPCIDLHTSLAYMMPASSSRTTSLQG